MDGTSFLFRVQYQEAKAPASTISSKADKKNMPQRKPKRLYTCM